MTWSGWLTVQDVSDGPAPIDVLAAANADDKVKPYEKLYPGTPDGDAEFPALQSNTEGKIRSVEVRFVIDADDPPLAVGDLIHVGGSFTARKAEAGKPR